MSDESQLSVAAAQRITPDPAPGNSPSSDRTPPSRQESAALYFGCWDQVGHGYHDPTGRSVAGRGPDVGPWGYGIDGWRKPRTGPQGSAVITHKDGWTALDVYDYTVDSRPGSHSVFLFPATLDFDQALESAKDFFPKIVARIGAIYSDQEGQS